MSADDGPAPEPGRSNDESFLVRLRTAERGPLFVVREVATSALTVAAVGLLLFGISGVWPPMVAIESGSMEPNMHKGDLVFITEPGRFAPQEAEHAGVFPYQQARATGYRQFGSYGSVVVYDNPNRNGPPVIHRARFWVERGENWYDEADGDYLGGVEDCAQLANCPAGHAGFITKGDANPSYDQANGISSTVKPGWIEGVARLRIPYLGWVRLCFQGECGPLRDPLHPAHPEKGRPGWG